MRLAPFQYRNIRLKDAYWLNNLPHFTKDTIGGWLGFKHPVKDVEEIIEDNPHIRQYQPPLKLRLGLAQNHNEKQTEFYNPIGLKFIVEEASSPIPIELHLAAARLVLAFVRKDFTQEGAPVEVFEDPKEIAQMRFDEINLLGHGKKGEAMEALSEELGITVKTLGGWKTQHRKTGKIEDKRKTTGPKKKIQTVHMERWKKIDALTKEGYSKKEIMKIMEVSESQVRRVNDRYKNRWFD